ncbi:MAG TPA: hypothetical protein VJ783_03645 [Pirellulales bacterium]|nr:hypothetical protein [Pirellulales bacterium]
MQTFDEFLADAGKQGRVHLLFESAMYNLVDELDQIVKVLSQAGVPFAVIGGMAVNAHLVSSQQASRAFVTRDIDLLVERTDLPTIVRAAEAAGYTARKIMGGHMLIRPGQQPGEAVRLVFAGEKSRSDHLLPHPVVRTENKEVFGIVVPVAALADLVRMKLNSYRAKDLVHLQTLDSSGLITPQLESELPAVLKERLETARKQFELEEPDVGDEQS